MNLLSIATLTKQFAGFSVFGCSRQFDNAGNDSLCLEHQRPALQYTYLAAMKSKDDYEWSFEKFQSIGLEKDPKYARDSIENPDVLTRKGRIRQRMIHIPDNSRKPKIPLLRASNLK